MWRGPAEKRQQLVASEIVQRSHGDNRHRRRRRTGRIEPDIDERRLVVGWVMHRELLEAAIRRADFDGESFADEAVARGHGAVRRASGGRARRTSVHHLPGIEGFLAGLASDFRLGVLTRRTRSGSYRIT